MTSKLPRYVVKRLQADGLEHYRFNPPQKYIDENLVLRQSLGTNLNKAIKIAHEYNTIIDEYLRKSSQFVNGKSTVKELYEEYILSNDYNMLRPKTQKDYKYFLDIMLDTNNFSGKRFKNITTPMCKQAYEIWVERGVSFANHIIAVSCTLYSYAVQMGHIETNPFKNVKRKTTETKRIIWSDTEIKLFLDTAYKKFEYRSVGLIAHMAYEWGQRLGDMRLLEWENILFEQKKLYLKQSKKIKEVFLPIDEKMLDMLQKQHNDFGFQKYVAPRPKPIKDEYRPYNLQSISKIGNCVIKESGIRQELQLMHLRATAITEMNDAGVGISQIMSVSGHSNPQSVKPYIKHTFTSANFALTQRNKNKTLDRL